MIETARSVRDLIDRAAEALRGAGAREARRDATRLWSDLLHDGIAPMMIHGDHPVDAAQADRYRAAVLRCVAGEPLAYVTGRTGFRHLNLRCDGRALIPRPETEGLVDAALDRVRTGVAADVGTGTGAIALALRQEGEFDQVFATDLSAAALELASLNGAQTGLDITLLAGDLVTPLGDRRVDLLVSNPPYLARREYDSLDRSVRDYEPAMALLAGDDGLSVTRRLIDEALEVVAPGGWLALEVDCRRAAETGRLGTAAGWQDVTVLEDLFGRARYLLARRGNGG